MTTHSRAVGGFSPGTRPRTGNSSGVFGRLINGLKGKKGFNPKTTLKNVVSRLNNHAVASRRARLFINHFIRHPQKREVIRLFQDVLKNDFSKLDNNSPKKLFLKQVIKGLSIGKFSSGMASNGGGSAGDHSGYDSGYDSGGEYYGGSAPDWGAYGGVEAQQLPSITDISNIIEQRVEEALKEREENGELRGQDGRDGRDGRDAVGQSDSAIPLTLNSAAQQSVTPDISQGANAVEFFPLGGSAFDNRLVFDEAGSSDDALPTGKKTPLLGGGGTIEIVKEQAEDLSGLIAALKEEIVRLKGVVGSQQSYIDELESNLMAKEAELKTVNELLLHLESELRATSGELDVAKRTILGLEARIAELLAHLGGRVVIEGDGKVKLVYKDRTETIEVENNDAIVQLQGELARWKARAEKAEALVSKLQGELEEIYQSFTVELGSLNAVIKGLKQEIAELERRQAERSEGDEPFDFGAELEALRKRPVINVVEASDAVVQVEEKSSLEDMPKVEKSKKNKVRWRMAIRLVLASVRTSKIQTRRLQLEAAGYEAANVINEAGEAYNIPPLQTTPSRVGGLVARHTSKVRGMYERSEAEKLVLHQRVNQFKARIKVLSNENTALDQKLQGAKLNLDKADLSLQALQEKNGADVAALRSLEASRNSLKSEFDQLTQAKKEMVERHTAEILEIRQAHTVELNTLRDELNASQLSFSELQKTNSQILVDLGQALADSEASQKKIEDASEEFDQVGRMLIATEKVVDDLRAKLALQSGDLLAQATEFHQALAEADGRLEIQMNEIIRLKKGAQDDLALRQVFEDELTAIRSERNSLLGKCQLAEEEVSRLSEQLTEVQLKMDSREISSAQVDSQEKKRLKFQLAKLRKDFSKLNEDYEGLSDEFSRVSRSQLKLKQENAALRDKENDHGHMNPSPLDPVSPGKGRRPVLRSSGAARSLFK